MTGTVIGLFYDPWVGLSDLPNSIRAPLRMWRKLICIKANPRSAEYMRARLDEHWPGARFVDAASETDWERLLDGAIQVVLLYPDAVGIGFAGLERRLRRVVPRAAIHVLNGRRRRFLLDVSTARAVRIRRFLECSMLVEAFLAVGLLIATPLLLCIDLARGRR